MALDNSGLDVSVGNAGGSNPNAVQMGIMKGRLQGLQHELQTAKRDIRDLSERLTATTTKLNEQKVQNSSLTHKYSTLIAKLSAAEEAEKQLEATLLDERRNTNALKDVADRYREQVEEYDETIRQLKQQLSAKPAVDPAIATAIKDRNQYIPTKEVVEKEAVLIREKESIVETMVAALARLVVGQEEDETSLFVCRSAVLSAATDLESKLAHTDHVIDTLGKLFQAHVREQEEETSRMMISLMNENKELWTHVTKMRFELDRTNTELAAKNKKHAESVPKDQHEYALKQVALLEEKMKRAQLTLEQQTRTEQEVEEKIRDLIQQLTAAKQKIDTLEEAAANSSHAIRERESELDAMNLSLNQKTQEVRELETLQIHQSAQIRSLSEQLHIVQEAFETEGRQQLKSIQAERDEAVDSLIRLRSDLEDSLHRMATLEKELDQRTTYFNSYKTSIEEQHASYARSLQEELIHSRQLFERELEDLRRELADRSNECHLVSRELDEERTERQGMKAALRTGEEELVKLRSDFGQSQSSLSRAEERIKRLSSELDDLRVAQTNNESKAQVHQQEVLRMQSTITQLEELLTEERQRHAVHASAIEMDWKESDKSRQALQDELKRLRSRVGEADQLRALKERMERDKEQLMSENVRLHQQYQDVQQQNVSLQQTITQLKARIGGQGQLSQQTEELQRKLQELPSLRHAADEARREALRAKEEMAVLRQERDEISARLEFFLDESRSAARKDNEIDRLFRDATSQVKRLDQQIEEASLRSATKKVTYQSSSTGGGGSPGARRSPVRPWRH